MATLHLVSNPGALQSCLGVAGDDDTVLLMEDGVYGATARLERRVLALAPDAAARGLSQRVPDTVQLVEYDEFVVLVEAHKPIVSWC